MNNPFNYTPGEACQKAFHRLLAGLEALKRSDRSEDVNFCRELEAGKMLGVLIAKDSCGVRHTLYAFSGQLGNGGFYHDGFVGPVFDYLQPGGYFKTNEADISRQNAEIAHFEEDILTKVRSEYEEIKGKLDAELEAYKEKCRVSKLERDAKRESGKADEAEMVAMIRQSQFEKAELRRLKKRAEVALEPYTTKLRNAQAQLEAMKAKRHSDSEALQQWLFSNFKLLNARGESRSLSEIFADTAMRIPPSGAGECCAPKLLQAAYLKGWQPIAIAEYWYGQPKGGEVRLHGEHYPACRGKCLPVLTWMLQGLSVEPPLDNDDNHFRGTTPEIIYENQWFCVVNKPSGMLSVPGKGRAISVQQWLEEQYGAEKLVKLAHRLDQDTSGLLIATFGPLSFKVMQTLFATRNVKKTYVADLEGDYAALGIPQKGRITLPLSPDYLDRPRQCVDFDGGKEAVTDYEFIEPMENDRAIVPTENGYSRVVFHPLTGRTHQLRVHAASTLGLGMPIVGDRLYGIRSTSGNPILSPASGNHTAHRLHLHARKIEFTFPIDCQSYIFDLPIPF